MLDENEKNQIEQWTNKKCGEVIFNSDKEKIDVKDLPEYEEPGVLYIVKAESKLHFDLVVRHILTVATLGLQMPERACGQRSKAFAAYQLQRAFDNFFFPECWHLDYLHRIV